MEKVGFIRFDGHVLDVYNDLDKPYFMAVEVGKLIDYSAGKTGQMCNMLEKDEYLTTTMYRSGQNRLVYMITELGLYNILSQSHKPIARKWRRIVNSNLIMMRHKNRLSIEGQFEEWDAIADNLYIDPDTGILMQSVTMPGGDVDQIPYEE